MGLVLRERHGLPDHLAIAASDWAWRERANIAARFPCTGGHALRSGAWVTEKRSAGATQSLGWNGYRAWLDRLMGARTPLWAITPDGSWRLWKPAEMDR